MLALVVAAAAAEEKVEEVIVWGDRFARWEERWTVSTQVDFPGQFLLYADNNLQLDLSAMQITLSLDCDVDFVLFRWSREVSCRIEDVGLVAKPRLLVETDELVLRELDATLTGAVIQLQVQQDGQVPDVDLEGIRPDNSRERERLEQLRQLLRLAIVPFHLTLPDPVRDGAQWYEYDSSLFTLPSDTAAIGGSTIAHYLDAVDPERFVIQSVGEAHLTSPSSSLIVTDLGSGFVEFDTRRTDIISLDLTSVAILDQATGIMSERVWAIRGEYTASSPNALERGGYYHVGRLRRLGQQEVVDVGPTFVARGASAQDTRPEWVPLEP